MVIQTRVFRITKFLQKRNNNTEFLKEAEAF